MRYHIRVNSEAGTLASDIKTRRRSLGLNQTDLATLAGTSVRFVGSLEAGKASIRLDKLLAVLTVLGLELRAELRRSE
jgi:HTH-type transcriptional regulator/antitoxin HipB